MAVNTKGVGEGIPDDDSDQSSSGGDEVEVKGTRYNLRELSTDLNVDEDSSGDEGDDEEAVQEENELEDDAKTGWADAMAKVLNVGKGSDETDFLLAKAKLDRDIKGLHSKGSNETGRAERPLVRLEKKRDIESRCRSQPDAVKDRAREKHLSKLATRGVVQLFNAVKEQQKDIKRQLADVGSSVRKREKVFEKIDKQSFLEVLTGRKGWKQRQTDSTGPTKAKRTKDSTTETTKEEEEEAAGGWSVIRDDFMLRAKMKDWDKASESEDN